MIQCGMKTDERGGVNCTRCGKHFEAFAVRYCEPGNPGRPSDWRREWGGYQPDRRGGWRLGDWVERRLRAIGVTKERWQLAKAWLGFRQSCGCPVRQAKLNAMAERARAWWRWA